MDINSGRAVETLKMNVDSFSIAPCVQREASSKGAIAACRLLHEAGVTVSLRGPVPEQLEVMRAGFPLKVRAGGFRFLVWLLTVRAGVAPSVRQTAVLRANARF